MADAEASPPLCWVLTETEHPFLITAASDIWYATWQLNTDAIGKPISILNGPTQDKQAGKLLMEQFKARGAATQRCANARSDGTVVKHTLSLVRTKDGLLAISTDMDTPEDVKLAKQDGHPQLLDISARIAADMHSQRMRTGAPAVSAADIAAAALDEIDEALDHLDEVKAALIAQEGPVEAWETSSETASIASSTSTMPSSASTMGVKPSVPMTKAESKRATTEGSGSYDSTMTTFAAELAVEEADSY